VRYVILQVKVDLICVSLVEKKEKICRT